MDAPRVIERSHYWVLHDPSSESPHGMLYVPRDGRRSFNGDYVNPTFSPSVNESWEHPDGHTCRNHYTVTAGRIQFHGDSTHRLAGQTVPVPPLTEAELLMYWPDGRKVVQED
jgi:hypothetical protein